MWTQRCIYILPLRLRSLFQRRQVEDELEEEFQFHVERKTERYIAQGLSPEDARHAAMSDMDGLERRKEECRDMRRLNFVDNLMGPSLRVPHDVPQSWLYHGGSALPCAGHWSNHGDLQFGQCGDAQDAPGKEPGTACGYQLESEDMAPDFAQRQQLGPAGWPDYGVVDFLSGLPAIARAKPGSVGSLCLCGSRAGERDRR